MQRKNILCLLIIIMVTGCSFLKNNKSEVERVIEKIPLMEFSNFKDIDVSKITSITYSRLTEGGKEDEEITDIDEIQKTYNNLSKIKVGQEVENTCVDNTRVYIFNMNDGKKISIEIECEWLVIGNKRYEINR